MVQVISAPITSTDQFAEIGMPATRPRRNDDLNTAGNLLRRKHDGQLRPKVFPNPEAALPGDPSATC